MVGALQAACPLHRLQSLCQAAHLLETPPWSLGPGMIWLHPGDVGFNCLPAQLSALRGGCCPWYLALYLGIVDSPPLVKKGMLPSLAPFSRPSLWLGYGHME